MIYRFRYLIYGVLGLILLVFLALFFNLFYDKENTFDFDKKSTRINSVFSKYDNKVFAAVPSNGYYEVQGADPTTFKAFDERNDAHVGFDAEHVYAGNIILEGLSPKTLVALGNNYYTDGFVTYYCNAITERNESLNAVDFIVQLIGYNTGLTGKPQNYWYPFKEVPKGEKYRSANAYGITISKNKVFYKGLVMPRADSKTLQTIFMNEKSGLRESADFFTDGKRVYYHNQLLPLSYNPSIHEIYIEGDVPSRNVYLMDEKNRMVYVDGKAFDSSKAPYQLLSRDLKHANHALFVGKDGVYFYNANSEKIERAVEFSTNDSFKEIAPDVVASANKVYYLVDGENWSRKRGLQGRSTYFRELNNVKASQLRKISVENLRYGGVWQFENRYFYFDDLGGSQMMHSAIYEFKNPATAKRISSSENLNTDDIRDLHGSGELYEPESEEIFEAYTEYPNDDLNYFFWIIGIGFGAVILIVFLLRNKKIAPFFLKDDSLILNNLTFSKFKINDIEKVVFSTVKSNYRTTSGYSGRVHVVRKNGKTSRNYLFSSKITLLSQSEDEILRYIKELQAYLKIKGIDSELR